MVNTAKKAAVKKTAPKPRSKSKTSQATTLPILEDIERRPKATDTYLWCDYIELRTLSGKDHKFSRDNLEELIAETKGLAPSALIDADENEDGLIGDEAENAVEDADRSAAEESSAIPDEDLAESRAADLFKALGYRAHLFGAAYPFALDASNREIHLLPFDTDDKKLYLQLLLSSSLRLVPKKRRHELTEPFEIIATKIFGCLMPNGWEVHRFGAKGVTRYTGHLYDRLKQLSADLNSTMMLERHHFKTVNSGDGGLDIVAWHPLGNDGRVGIPIALAQCGCTAEEWSLKMLEASPPNIRPKIAMLHPPATYYFMPQDLVMVHDSKNDWQRRLNLTECIVIDRLRFIKIAHQYGIENACANAPTLVNEAKSLNEAMAA